MSSPKQTNITARTFGLWCLSFLIVVALAVVSFRHFDVPVAKICQALSPHMQMAARGMAGTILVCGEALVILLIVIIRNVHGSLPKFARVLAVACITSICCYALNCEVLKVIFGVPNPGQVLISGQIHTFHWLQGTQNSSFPSGHMMLAAGWGGVFIYCYPKTVKFISTLLFFGMCLLVAGGWHFISDVLLGTFCGLTGGLLVGKIWLLHIKGTSA